MSATPNETAAMRQAARSVAVRPRVLVVEDQFLIAATIRVALSERGCEVLGPAGNLAEAQRLLRISKPDAAVLNFRLDGTTTADLARTLIREGCPVMFISGHAAHTDVPEDLQTCPWLEKPDVGAPLAEALLRLLARKKGPDAPGSPGESGSAKNPECQVSLKATIAGTRGGAACRPSTPS